MVDKLELVTYLYFFSINIARSFLYLTLPLLYKQKNYTQTYMGLIFMTYPIVQFITSQYIGQYLHLYKKHRLISYGIILNTLAYILVGTVQYIDNKEFLSSIYLIICRIIEGLGSSLTNTTIFSIVTQYFEEEKLKQILGMINASIGLGFILGPILGAGLWTAISFDVVCYIYGLLLFIYIFWMKSIIKQIMNTALILKIKQIGKNEIIDLQQTREYRRIRYKFYLMSFCITLTMMGYTAMYISLPLQLDEFGFKKFEIGMFFIIFPLSFTIMNFIIRFIQFGNLNNKFILLISLFAQGITNLIAGPTNFIMFQDLLSCMAIGQILIGIISSFISISVLPELNSILIEEVKYKNNEIIQNFCSGIFNSFMALGLIIGPLFGNFMYNKYNFRTMYDMLAIIYFSFTCIFFFSFQDFEIYKTKSYFYKKIAIRKSSLNDQLI